MSEQAYIIAKADRSWKNISQYETEGAQGRRRARHGQAVGSVGMMVGGTGLAYGGTRSMGRLSNDVKVARKARKIRHALGREVPGLRSLNRSATRRDVSAVVRRNPVALATLGGAGVAATGAGMWASGRAKARHSERQIGRLRRKRSKAG